MSGSRRTLRGRALSALASLGLGLGRGLVLVLVAFGITGCNRYKQNDLELLPAFTSKSMCSCMFVMKQTEAFCREWTRVDPDAKTISIDTEAKTVEAQTLGLWGGKARFISQRKGCVLE
jgi:hypothetical protein